MRQKSFTAFVGILGLSAASALGQVAFDGSGAGPALTGPGGACCKAGDWCDISTAGTCPGAYQGDGTDCSACYSDPAVCCGPGFDVSDRCVVISAAAGAAHCTSISGTLYRADQSECTPDPGNASNDACPPPNVCGDNVVGGSEECDGTDDAACLNTGCQADCTCTPAACCYGDNTCNVESVVTCFANGGRVFHPCCDCGPKGICGTCCHNQAGDCQDYMVQGWCDIKDGGFNPGGFCTDAAPCVPALSEWGLIVLVALGLTAGTIVFRRRTELLSA